VVRLTGCLLDRLRWLSTQIYDITAGRTALAEAPLPTLPAITGWRSTHRGEDPRRDAEFGRSQVRFGMDLPCVD